MMIRTKDMCDRTKKQNSKNTSFWQVAFLVPRDQFLQHFDVGILFLQAFNTEMLLFVEKSGFCQFLFNTSYVTK